MENEWKNSAQTRWVAENVEGFEQIIKEMVKIIEEGNASDEGAQAQVKPSKKDHLISLVEKISLKHQLLAEQCDHMIDDLHKSSETQKENLSSAFDQGCLDSSLLTPDQKLVSQKKDRATDAFDFSLSSDGSSFINSGKEGSQSSAIISSDSDSESYDSATEKDFFTPMSVEMPNAKILDMETGFIGAERANGLREMEPSEMMLLRISKYEKELKASKKELLSSNQEVMRLHSELKNALVAMDNSEAQLEKAKNEVKMKEDYLVMEKRNVSELRTQVVQLETEVLDSSRKIGKLEQENEDATGKLESSEGKLAELRKTMLTKEYEHKKMKVDMQDALRVCEIEKAQLQSENSSLSGHLTLVEAKVTQLEEQIRKLESEIKKCETSKIEMKNVYETQEIRWQGEIQQLNTQLIEKCELVESLNKTQDGLKLKYDMLMAEKDGLSAKAQTLFSELCSAEFSIQQMEAQLCKLQSQHVELIAGSETMLKLKGELESKVEKLEKEVEKQAALIVDRAEEKREAIRQLCFSLEHYRRGYQELREAWIGQRRHAVIAS
ncbi:OLC1v1027023C1 [Oldenlandia corymbosa var. corymbosa]|uniref:OLC1v1027023C1 n=1 Tax=Oldenlandia corymbosa var. corymbosa TaxID=529605 RepID=A0AAV1C9Q4_OLDCO|nr:OLC1v1027023C1 [Oldenlandia corymbosa var. corymbosa]